MSRLCLSLAVGALSAASLSACSSCNGGNIRGPEDRPVDEVPIVPAPSNVGQWLSMRAASDGTRLTIAFYDQEFGALGYATGLPNEDLTVTWTYEQADGYPEPSGLDPVQSGKYASHEVTADGFVWAAHQNVGTSQLRVAQRTAPQAWTAEDVEAGGAWASLALDGNGVPVVAHCDDETGEVKLARRQEDKTWSSQVLFTGGAEGVSHTRAFANGDVIWVAFRDETQRILRVARVEGSDVSLEELDVDGDVGEWPSIGLDGTSVVIAYHDVGREDLRVATRNENGTWRRSVADDGENRGADTEVFSMNGELAVVYHDGVDNDLRLARRGSNGWELSAVGTDGPLGFHNEVAFAAGHWWAASYDPAARSLFVTALD